MLRKTLLTGVVAALLLPQSAPAAPAPVAYRIPDAGAHRAQLQLTGAVYVERFEPAPGGRTARVLEHADALHSGDRLVFVVSWNGGDPAGLVVTNPVPRSVLYLPGSDDATEQVSVDGGHTWGVLNTLLVHDCTGWRRALPQDVTHVRWHVPGAQAAAGQITYRGIVR